MSSLNSAHGPSFDQLLSDAFRAGLDLPAESDVSKLVFGQHQQWDSLGHISLVVAIEETFGVSLSETDVLEIDSYATAAVVLKSKNLASS